MLNTKFIGKYKNFEGEIYEITVYTTGLIQAFYLLPPNMTISDKNYQLNIISNDIGQIMNVTN